MRLATVKMSLALVFLVGSSAVARGEDGAVDEPKKTVKKREVRVIAVPAGAKHWIGIQTSPIEDEALKAQLKLDGERLIVVQVVPESPSAKAGLRQHDVLLKLGDHELCTLEDLIKAVDANGGQQTTLEVLRSGEKTTLAIQPAERPTGAAIVEAVPQNLRVTIEEALEGEPGEGGKKQQMILRMLGPGIAADAKAFAWSSHGAPFPAGWSLSVSKENDQPAQIVAKKGDQTYEAAEGKLDSLPEEIRPHVVRLLEGHPHAMAFGLADLKGHHLNSAKIQAEVRKTVEEAKKKSEEAREEIRAAHEQAAKSARGRIEAFRSAEAGVLDELRKEVEALRREVQQLREKKKED